MTINQPEVCVGGCLRVNAQGELVINTGGTNWPYECRESEGAPLYCGTDGVLRTRPVPSHRVNSAVMNAPATRLLNGGSTPTLVGEVQNPSECLAAIVQVTGWVQARYQVSAGNRWELSVRTFLVGGDDPIQVPFAGGRGAAGGGPERGRAVVTGGNIARAPMIQSEGDVRRVSAGTTERLVQSDAPVSINNGVLWATNPVDTSLVALDNGSRELGVASGAPRPRWFRVEPRETLRYRMTVVGTDGHPGLDNQGDTFSDVNMALMLSLTTMQGVP